MIGKTIANRNITRLVALPQLVTDPLKMDPDALRDAVRNALLARNIEERGIMIGRIASSLTKAGFNISSAAVLLGIHQETINDLTPSDLAHLIRYVRINSPGLLKAAAGPLNELTSASEAGQRPSRPSKAA